METIALAVVVCAAAFWVYWDATEHKIGKIEGDAGFFNMSAGAWSTTILFFLIVGLPAYLINRSKLLDKARMHPANSGVRTIGATALVLVTLIATSGGIVEYLERTVPACDSPGVASSTDRIIRQSPATRILGLQDVVVSSYDERSYDRSRQIRQCGAVLSSSLGEGAIAYTVWPNDKHTGEFWLQILEIQSSERFNRLALFNSTTLEPGAGDLVTRLMSPS